MTYRISDQTLLGLEVRRQSISAIKTIDQFIEPVIGLPFEERYLNNVVYSRDLLEQLWNAVQSYEKQFIYAGTDYDNGEVPGIFPPTRDEECWLGFFDQERDVNRRREISQVAYVYESLEKYIKSSLLFCHGTYVTPLTVLKDNEEVFGLWRSMLTDIFRIANGNASSHNFIEAEIRYIIEHKGADSNEIIRKNTDRSILSHFRDYKSSIAGSIIVGAVTGYFIDPGKGPLIGGLGASVSL